MEVIQTQTHKDSPSSRTIRGMVKVILNTTLRDKNQGAVPNYAPVVWDVVVAVVFVV